MPYVRNYLGKNNGTAELLDAELSRENQGAENQSNVLIHLIRKVMICFMKICMRQNMKWIKFCYKMNCTDGSHLLFSSEIPFVHSQKEII